MRRVRRKLQNSLFVNLSLAKQKECESQTASALAEPPGVHGMNAITGLEELDRKGHEEVVEEQIYREFQHGLVRRVVNGKHIRKRVAQTPHHSAQAHDYQGAIDEGRKQDFAKLGSEIPVQHISNGVELGVVRVSYKVYMALLA